MKPEANNDDAPLMNAADHAAIAAEIIKQNAAADTAAKAAAAATAAAPVAATPAAEPTAAEAVAADRARIASIMALPEAKGREALASTLAANGMTVEGAKASLALAPAASITPPPDQRQTGAELGGDGAVKPSGEQIKTGWANAFKRVS